MLKCLKKHETGNLRKVLQLKIGAKIRLTTNINVSDGLKMEPWDQFQILLLMNRKKRLRLY